MKQKTKVEAINFIIGKLRGRDGYCSIIAVLDAQHRAELARQLRKLSIECLNTLSDALEKK